MAPRELLLPVAVVRLLARAEHRLGTVSGAASRLINPYLVSAQMLRREAILSSRIEETIATPEQVALMELDGEGRTEETREVGNFVRAMEHALTAVQAGIPITGRLLLETHKVLMTGVRGDRERPGEFRTTQNFIGRSTDIHAARFVPPPHLELPALLGDLEHLVNEDVESMPTLARIAVAHYQFETIHPFRDGNGRIGRLIATLMLVREGLLPGPFVPLSSALERRREEYVDLLLRVSMKGDWNSWLTFFFECVIESADEAIGLITALDRLRAEFYARMQAARSSVLLIKLVDALFARPATTIAEVGKLLGVTPATASASISKLEDAGILREITGRTRDRVYVSPPILDLMTDRQGRPAHSEATR
jgi:Fic family protein